MEAQFYRRDELAHWGIKGQKWGVRRYQNEDGTLTEEGKIHYMEAARSGKLDPRKLSDKDLDMINNRFNKEKQYANNVSEYQKNRFSNRLKDAVITRIKGDKKGGKNGGGVLSKTIKKAFEDAMKNNGSSNEKDNTQKQEKEKEKAKAKVKATVDEYNPSPKKKKADIERGKQMFREWAERESVLGLPSGYVDLNPDEYSVHSGVTGCFIITRDDTYALYHHDIKGQKWGVRRYQNEDGTLTKLGKSHVAKTSGSGYLNPSYEDISSGKASERKKVGDKYSQEYWKAIKNGMDENEPSEQGRKLWNKFKNEYASATLKDLGMIDTTKARQDVKKLLSEIDKNYKYGDLYDYSEGRDEMFKKRRDEIEHPNKKKAIAIGKTAYDVAKVLK